jgi:hypothetical protein
MNAIARGEDHAAEPDSNETIVLPNDAAETLVGGWRLWRPMNAIGRGRESAFVSNDNKFAVAKGNPEKSVESGGLYRFPRNIIGVDENKGLVGESDGDSVSMSDGIQWRRRIGKAVCGLRKVAEEVNQYQAGQASNAPGTLCFRLHAGEYGVLE